jgi:thiamine biosynthesis lipoprotein
VTVPATATPGTRIVEHVMGIPIVVDVRDEGGEEALEKLFDWLRWVDATFSTFKPDSEINRLGRRELALADAHPDVREVLERCESLRVETDGYFDAYAAGRLDPSGLVKGWAVDRGAALLEESGLRNFAINAGGDIVLSGGALPDFEWRVGIEHPLRRDRVAAVVAIRDGAVATSGAYARGDHVVDPHTGRPSSGVLSVTITGPDLATADAYATAAFAMGPAGAPWTARLRGYEALTILADRRVLSTPNFPRAEP